MALAIVFAREIKAGLAFFHLGLLPMSSAVARWLAASLVAAVATEAFVVAPGTTSVGAIGEGRRAPGVRPRRAPWVATPALRATAAGNVASPEAAAAAAAGGYEPAIRIGHGFDIHRLAPRDEAGDGHATGNHNSR